MREKNRDISFASFCDRQKKILENEKFVSIKIVSGVDL